MSFRDCSSGAAGSYRIVKSTNLDGNIVALGAPTRVTGPMPLGLKPRTRPVFVKGQVTLDLHGEDDPTAVAEFLRDRADHLVDNLDHSRRWAPTTKIT